jgi:hypothetical protein
MTMPRDGPMIWPAAPVMARVEKNRPLRGAGATKVSAIMQNGE